jgi:hypothetical protein
MTWAARNGSLFVRRTVSALLGVHRPWHQCLSLLLSTAPRFSSGEIATFMAAIQCVSRIVFTSLPASDAPAQEGIRASWAFARRWRRIQIMWSVVRQRISLCLESSGVAGDLAGMLMALPTQMDAAFASNCLLTFRINAAPPGTPPRSPALSPHPASAASCPRGSGRPGPNRSSFRAGS